MTRTSTPVSPSSCSAWSRKEAIWYNPRASPGSDSRGGNRSPTTPTSHIRKKVRRTETEHSLPEKVVITDPLDNILAQHGCPPAISSTSQRDEHQEVLEKASLAPLRQDLKKVSKDLSEVKGILGGASGYPTVHQMVVGLDHRVQGDGERLRAIQDSLNSLGERIAGVSAVQEQQTRIQGWRENQDLQDHRGGTEDVLRLLENIQSQLSSVFPSVVGKLTQIADTQEKEKEKQQQQEKEQVAYRNIDRTRSDTEKPVEMETVLAKLEEILKLCHIQVQLPDSPGDKKDVITEPPEVGFLIFIIYSSNN